ncbi:MAG: glycoside hydrolase family 10 protein, partial [Tannerella sp.]|nr:glycoside hydrolase family 10 protein [Tannerella sp.]
TYGAELYVGLAPYRVDKESKDKQWRSSKQILKQIDRNMQDPNIRGEVFYSAKQIFKNQQVQIEKRLTEKEYKYKTLSPENGRIKRMEAESPKNLSMEIIDDKYVKLRWNRGENAKRFVIYKFKKNKPKNLENPEFIIDVTGLTEAVIPCKQSDLKKYRIGVTSLSPSHTESAIAYFN